MKSQLGWRIGILLLVAIAVVGVVAMKQQQERERQAEQRQATESRQTVTVKPVDENTGTPQPAPAKVLVPPVKKIGKAPSPTPVKAGTQKAVSSVKPGTQETKNLPRILELGSESCQSCRMMLKVLGSLRTEYAGKLKVDIIDVWKNPKEGEQYGIEGIPTQILFDAQGKEIYRHMGYFPKADIIAKFTELGVTL
ncbi:MAG: thioredoxin family protein [Armatimonadota bacterium]